MDACDVTSMQQAYLAARAFRGSSNPHYGSYLSGDGGRKSIVIQPSIFFLSVVLRYFGGKKPSYLPFKHKPATVFFYCPQCFY